jgi:uncharacterized membrane-anchored protein
MNLPTLPIAVTRPRVPESRGRTQSGTGNLLRKVPEVTILFWIIKILCTTVGETAGDFLAILLTFALGTAAGDLVGESLSVGYAWAALWFGGAIVALALAHLRFGLGAIIAFWVAYVITPPLGASIGDLLS